MAWPHCPQTTTAYIVCDINDCTAVERAMNRYWVTRLGKDHPPASGQLQPLAQR